MRLIKDNIERIVETEAEKTRLINEGYRLIEEKSRSNKKGESNATKAE